MKFINIDPLKTGHEEVEIYRAGEFLTDIYNGCTLVTLTAAGGKLTLELKVVHEAGKQKIGTTFDFVFSDFSARELDLEGGLDDLGQLEGIAILDEPTGLVEIQLAHSLKMVFNCSSLELKGL